MGFLVRRIAPIAGGVIVALILAEIGLALFYKQEEILQRDLFVRDPSLGFRMVAHYDGELGRTTIPLATNSWGFRDREYGEPPAHGLRILVLGDSMVFGQGVRIEETYPRHLERLLSERHAVQIEVVNGGIPGYGTTQEAALFEQIAEVIKPDLLLVSVAIFNDVSDNLKFFEQFYRWQGERSLARKLRFFFRHHSQLYMMLRRYRAGRSGSQMMDIHANQPSDRVAEGLRLTEEGLLRLARAAADRGIAFGAIINPAHKQTSPQLWMQALSQYQLDPERFGYDEPNRRLMDFAAQHQIPVLDLLSVFRAQPDETLYFTDHWRSPGHQLVAGEVAKFLEGNGLLAKALASSR